MDRFTCFSMAATFAMVGVLLLLRMDDQIPGIALLTAAALWILIGIRAKRRTPLGKKKE